MFSTPCLPACALADHRVSSGKCAQVELFVSFSSSNHRVGQLSSSFLLAILGPSSLKHPPGFEDQAISLQHPVGAVSHNPQVTSLHSLDGSLTQAIPSSLWGLWVPRSLSSCPPTISPSTLSQTFTTTGLTPIITAPPRERQGGASPALTSTPNSPAHCS